MKKRVKERGVTVGLPLGLPDRSSGEDWGLVSDWRTVAESKLELMADIQVTAYKAEHEVCKDNTYDYICRCQTNGRYIGRVWRKYKCT